MEPEFIAKVIADFTPGAAGIWTGVLMFAGWLAKEWRETRKLSAEDRVARRDGYAKQVEMLMKENRELGVDMRELREEYDLHRRQCQIETDQLRRMVIDLEGKLEGLNRQRASDAIELARLKGQSSDRLPPIPGES